MRCILLTLALLVTLPGAASIACGQEGNAERIGKQIDRGVSQFTEELRETWAQIRERAEKMSVESRVYVRLRWDKATHDAPIDIEVRNGAVVVLKGSVPDQLTRGKTVQLARDTVGVTEVIDELVIASPRISRQ